MVMNHLLIGMILQVPPPPFIVQDFVGGSGRICRWWTWRLLSSVVPWLGVVSNVFFSTTDADASFFFFGGGPKQQQKNGGGRGAVFFSVLFLDDWDCTKCLDWCFFLFPEMRFFVKHSLTGSILAEEQHLRTISFVGSPKLVFWDVLESITGICVNQLRLHWEEPFKRDLYISISNLLLFQWLRMQTWLWGRDLWHVSWRYLLKVGGW